MKSVLFAALVAFALSPVAYYFAFPVSAQELQAAALIEVQIEGKQPISENENDGLTLLELLAKFKVPGASVAVIKDFKLDWAKGYGLADVQTGEAVQTSTMFQAASISKPVFAMAVMKAVQDGRLNLDLDVNKYLSSWNVPASDFNVNTPVTPRSLLSHTSGADDGLGFPGYAPDTQLPTLVQIINGEKPANTRKVTFARAPFTAYKYSGGGMTIMQLAFSEHLQKPFADSMKTMVLVPLGMSNSTYEQPAPANLSARTARAHNREGKAQDVKWHVYPEQAAAGLWTTPGDLASYLIEIQKALAGSKAKVLTRKSAQEMITPTGVGSFGVGLAVDKRGEGWYFSHSGSNWGFQCDMVSHFRKGYGVVVMTNGDNGGAVIREIEARVARAYKWDSLDKPLRR